MKKIIVKNKVLKVYDSIDELPILNFQKFNKFLLIDSGIGSSIDDIDKHITKIARLMKTDSKKAILELQNMRQCMYMVTSCISPLHMSFATLIYSIDGKLQTDLSDENLKSIMYELKEVKHSWLLDFIMKFKKKVNDELDTYFPNTFSDIKEKEAYDKLKQRTIFILDSIITGKNNAEVIDEIDDQLFNLHKPHSFSGIESIEVKYEKQFDISCIYIQQKTGMDARSMSVLQFYNTIETIKNQAENEVKYNTRKR